MHFIFACSDDLLSFELGDDIDDHALYEDEDELLLSDEGGFLRFSFFG